MQNKETISTVSFSPVTYLRQGRVGVIRIDNPPVNALSQAVRQGLLDALRQAQDDHDTEVVILVAVGRTFIAGADIREFGKPPQAPILSDVVNALEASDKPLIAVLHGTALGGGLEIALGCHLRIAIAGTRVGLPEVKLGLLPGAGGTQRLPRLVGVDYALDLITSGRTVEANEAHAHGIVDDVVSAEEPLMVGLTTAEALLRDGYVPRRTGQLPAPAADPDACECHQQRLEWESPYLFSPFRCIDAVEASTRRPLAEGLARERELFLSCMDSPQRAGMIHAFFATRGTHKVPGADDAPPLTRLGLLGNHPWLEALFRAADQSEIDLIRLDDDAKAFDTAALQACLVAPDINAARYQALVDALPDDVAWIEVASATERCDQRGGGIQLVPSPLDARQPICELVDLAGHPALTQALAFTLKQLKCLVVVTRKGSVTGALHTALVDTLADHGDAQVAAWQTEGWDLSPWHAASTDTKLAPERLATDRQPLEVAWQQTATRLSQSGHVYRDSDIDVLAIHAFGYPAHRGGPCFRSQTSP